MEAPRLKSPNRKAAPARKPPAGGPAMMNGVAYQLLWSFLRVWKGTVCDVLEGPTDLQPRGVTVILEPPEGGDLEVPGAVEQIKARSNGGAWSLEEVIRDVLPDLYKACRARQTPMRYRFVTEGSMGEWKDVNHDFFQSLGTRAIQGSDPLAVLDDEQELASAKENPALARKIRETGEGYTERGIFLYIARVLTGEDGESKGKGKRKVQDPPDVLYGNLLRLLGSFEFKGGQQWPVIEDEVLRELSARGAKRTEQTLKSLLGDLLLRAGEGGAVVERGSLLAQYGLQAISLYSWDLIVRESRLFLQRTLNLHGYRASEDCRERRPLLNLLQAENGEPVVAWGESGQGKSWLVYGTADELAQRDEVVLLLDSTQDVLRDRDEAARLFCERIWGTDERYSLDRLAQRVRQQVPERSGRPWLTVLIDGVRDRRYLMALVRQEWEAIGVRVAVAFTTDTQEPERLEEGVLLLYVRDFSHREVLRYLRLRLGSGVPPPPRDILRLLRHPLWARLSCDRVPRGGQWQSANEYQVIEEYWTGQAAHAPIATDALTELASRLIEGEDYPWSLSRLREIGIGEIELDRLAQTHLVQWVHGGRMLELWHERLLHWAIAEGLVSGLRARRLTSEELRNRIRARNEGEGGRRFGYVPMDALWLLADPAAPREEDVLGLLQLFEELRGLFALVPTIGGRIVPHIFARLRQIAGESSYLEIRYLEMLESMEEPSIAGFAVEMLNEGSVRLQKIAARILATHGDPQALDRLWTLYREWSEEVETRGGSGAVEESEVDFHDVVQVDKALGSCVSSAPDWLDRTIRMADAATDPVHTLVFLIPKVEHGKELWQRIKRVAFEKVQPTRQRSLAVCIAYFLGRPLDRLSGICHPILLQHFWWRRGTDLERNLAAWLIREGPWEEKWRRHAFDAGLSVLHKIAGEGIVQVANSYFERATTYWGRKAAFDLALRVSDERTIELLTQVAFQEHEHPTGSGTVPLDQREALQVLASYGNDTIVVRGVVRWGLLLPPDFDWYLDGRGLGDAELAPALEALSHDPRPPGAVFALGPYRPNSRQSGDDLR